MSHIFIDMQGFRDTNNNFIIKELALATSEHTQVFLVKPPYSYHCLGYKEKKIISWIERNLGIFWREGLIDYREFKRTILPFLTNKNILVKDQEKVKWIKDLCYNCSVIDIGEKGCPNFLSLYNKYVGKHNDYNCFTHKKHCALKMLFVLKSGLMKTVCLLYSTCFVCSIIIISLLFLSGVYHVRKRIKLHCR